MTKKVYYSIFILLLLTACQSQIVTSAVLPTLQSPSIPSVTSTQVAITPTLVTSPTVMVPTPTIIASPTSSPTSTSTISPFPVIQPVVNQQTGDLYETIFSISVGPGNPIRYLGGGDTEIVGPNAIAVLPDGSFMIADPVSNSLFRYDQAGKLLNTIELEKLGIKTVRDLRARDNELFLLETGTGPIPQRYWVHHLSIDGTLVGSDEIPINFPLGPKPEFGEPLTLKVGLTGITIDCDGDIVLEIEGGYKLFRLEDVQNNSRPDNIPNGYLCNGKLYHVIEAIKLLSKFKAGDVTYITQLTTGLGGLISLGVYPYGGFYLIRDDVVNSQMIQVDKTVHFVGSEGIVQGVARVPLSEFYYPIIRNMAIGPTGEVFAILPRPDSIDIIRLNFYTQLGPLIQSAVIPQITISPNSP